MVSYSTAKESKIYSGEKRAPLQSGAGAGKTGQLCVNK